MGGGWERQVQKRIECEESDKGEAAAVQSVQALLDLHADDKNNSTSTLLYAQQPQDPSVNLQHVESSGQTYSPPGQVTDTNLVRALLNTTGRTLGAHPLETQTDPLAQQCFPSSQQTACRTQRGH